jgi:predicted transcriptional regulator
LRRGGSLKSKRKNPEELVLSILRELGESNINTLRRKTGLNYYVLLRALESLISRGIIIERRIGRLRLFVMSTGDQHTV